ncbi:hypothetical protein AURDEDRAFT_164325 [Auricularia subglabra TFB-10046 SS5]|nr:hypothetical protein AURDEDRAFT_164325 [Auricularia subglabra TFB-10046 SS5]
MADISNKNSFAAIAATYSSSEEDNTDETTTAAPAVAQASANSPSGDEFTATTRPELDLTLSPLSSAGERPSTPPPVAGVIRGRDDVEQTPSAIEAHAERTAHINAVNNRPRVVNTAGSEVAVNAIDDEIAIHQGAHILVPETQLPPITAAAGTGTNGPLVVGEVTIPAQRPRLINHPPRRSAPALSTGQHLRRPSFVTTLPPIREETSSLGGGDRMPSSSRRPPSPPLPIKMELLTDFQQRLQLNPRSRVNRSSAPSPTASTSRDVRAGTSLALAIDVDAPRPRAHTPRSVLPDRHAAGPGADVDMADADGPLPSPIHGAQPARSPSPDPAALQPLEPRMEDVVSDVRLTTDREQAALAAINPSLAHSTIPFKGFGGRPEINGQARRFFLRGLTAADIKYYDDKPGHKGVFIMHSINGSAASNYASNDQLGTLENHLDRLHPFGDRVQCAKLHTSTDAPRGMKVLPNAIVMWGMNAAQHGCFMPDLFINIGCIQGMFHDWEPEQPTFATCIEGIRSSDNDTVCGLACDAIQTDAGVTGCISRQALEDGTDSGGLLAETLKGTGLAGTHRSTCQA